MSVPLMTPAGTEAIVAKGWLRAHKWLLLRRLSQCVGCQRQPELQRNLRFPAAN
jgi:hypothetical protein